MYAITRIPLKALGPLLGVLLLASCNVTEPDDSPWRNIADFSWPTDTTVSMKYRTIIADTIYDESEVTIGPSDSFYDSQPMYTLNDPDKESTGRVRFLPTKDVLIVQQERFGGDSALVAPLEKGHTWVSGNDGKSYWTAEIIELFSYRKVEGKIYRNVVAVKYVQHWPQGRPKDSDEGEWIRFYAQGVGEIMTVLNTYPESTLSNPIPRQDQRTVLVETTAVN